MKETFIAGACAGTAPLVLLYPLDVLKARFQVQEIGSRKDGTSPYRSLRHAVSSIYRTEGIVGFYRGFGISVFGAGFSWAMYMYAYERCKLLNQSTGLPRSLAFLEQFLAGIQAGVIATVVTNPIWVIKLRLQVQGDVCIGSSTNYAGVFDAVKTIARTEGVHGFFRGVVPALWLVSQGAFNFMFYEQINHAYVQYRGGRQLCEAAVVSPSPSAPTEPLEIWETLVLGVVAKVMATTITYPIQVIRSQMQKAPGTGTEYRTAHLATAALWRREGFRGLFRGLWPCLLRTSPSAGITWVVYENVKHLLRLER